jgi:phage terminase Nu1 subunit (DNA packaging protein)
MFALVRMALGPRVPNAQQMVQKYARAASLVSIRLATNAKKICANVIMELVLRVPSVQHMANIIARVVSGSSM